MPALFAGMRCAAYLVEQSYFRRTNQFLGRRNGFAKAWLHRIHPRLLIYRLTMTPRRSPHRGSIPLHRAMRFPAEINPAAPPAAACAFMPRMLLSLTNPAASLRRGASFGRGNLARCSPAIDFQQFGGPHPARQHKPAGTPGALGRSFFDPPLKRSIGLVGIFSAAWDWEEGGKGIL